MLQVSLQVIIILNRIQNRSVSVANDKELMSLINSCEDESKLATKSSFLNTEIRHVEQASKNDCGHACARMALK